MPRYSVLGTSALTNACAPHESVRYGAILYLKLDTTTSFFYVSSLQCPENIGQNILSESPLYQARTPLTLERVREVLACASNVTIFSCAASVRKGVELVLDYRVVCDETVDGNTSDSSSDMEWRMAKRRKTM